MALTATELYWLTLDYLDKLQTLDTTASSSSGQADFGKERKFGTIFWAVGAVLEGLLID